MRVWFELAVGGDGGGDGRDTGGEAGGGEVGGVGLVVATHVKFPCGHSSEEGS